MKIYVNYRFLLGMLLFGPVACLQGAGKEGTGNHWAINQIPEASHAPDSWLDSLPKILTMSVEADKIIQNLSYDTRKKLMILAENNARIRNHPFSPTEAKFVEVPRDKIKSEIVSTSLLNKSEKDQALRRVAIFSQAQSQSHIKIPIHPETKAHHPLIQRFLDQGYQIRSSTQALWPTMSRSLWVWPDDGLYTIKLPTDTVNGSYQPQKLASENDHVALYISQINSLNHLVASPFLKKNGIILLPDAAGLKVSLAVDQVQPYGVIFRDYERLLERRSYIYLPQQTVKSAYEFFTFKGHRVLGIGLDGRRQTAPPETIHRLFFNAVQWRDLVYHLESQVQILHAFFLSQGYHYPYQNFHGQNVMFGISLKPGATPELVLRDIFDINDLTQESSHSLQNLDLGLIGLHISFLGSLFGCQGVFDSGLERSARLDRIFLGTMRDLGFELPKDYSWDKVKTKKDLEDLLKKPEHKSHFVMQMRKIRKNSLNRR